MNNPTIISTYHMQCVSDWMQEADRFEYDPKGKWPSIQRACFWVLHKLGAFAQLRVESVKRVEINLDNVVEALMQNQLDIELIHNKRARYVVIGHDAFCRLTNSEQAPPFYAFDVPPNFRANVSDRSGPLPYFFRGLKVVVVPWVDGMFVLPDLDK